LFNDVESTLNNIEFVRKKKKQYNFLLLSSVSITERATVAFCGVTRCNSFLKIRFWRICCRHVCANRITRRWRQQVFPKTSILIHYTTQYHITDDNLHILKRLRIFPYPDLESSFGGAVTAHEIKKEQ